MASYPYQYAEIGVFLSLDHTCEKRTRTRMRKNERKRKKKEKVCAFITIRSQSFVGFPAFPACSTGKEVNKDGGCFVRFLVHRSFGSRRNIQGVKSTED